MIHKLFQVKNYLPTDGKKTVYDIDYNKLYESGKRLLLIDLDNTLMMYTEDVLSKDALELLNSLVDIGFRIIIISNNTNQRVSLALESIDLKYIPRAKKPYKSGFKKVANMYPQYLKSEMILIGDQLMTDVLGANRFGIDVILVKSLERESEKWYTRFNRRLERLVLKKMKKKYPDKYELILQVNEEGNNE